MTISVQGRTITPHLGIPTQAPPKRLVACGWCDSTHIADVTCTCKDPCARGWCPAAVVSETPFH